jgi:outer membrane protein
MKLKPILLATLLAASGWAQAADLLQTFHAAQANDPVFAAARAQQQASLEKLPQGRSQLMPTINFSANTAYNSLTTDYNPIFPPLLTNATVQYNSNGYGLTLVQPLFRAQNWLSYTESELQAAQAGMQFRIAEQDLILRVAKAYFDVLIAQDSVQLAETQKAAISEQLAQAKRNFEVGTATVTDTLEAQARYDLTASQEIAAQNDLDIKRSALQQLINSPPQDLKPLGKEFKPEPPQPADMSKWLDAAQQTNLELAIAQKNDQIAEDEVARNRAGHYPTVDLVANYAQINSSASSFGGNLAIASNNTARSIGVQLNIPLYEGGLVNSKTREAAANRERARQDLENARRNVEHQTRQAYLGVVSGMSQVQALQQALASSESLLEASKLGHEVGVRTNLDVLNAQQQLYSTRRDFYQAQYNYLVSELQLKAAAGSLKEEDLQKVNQALY